MALSDEQRQIIAAFRDWLEASTPPGGAALERFDREDESTLATRWPAAERTWWEVAVRPFLPQVRVGVLTDDRWKSEELEQRIEDSGDTKSEYVEEGFEAAGLSWSEPPVEHYREHGKFFYFATPLELGDVRELADDLVRTRVRQMLAGYRAVFG
jgi:hypothetical protein